MKKEHHFRVVSIILALVTTFAIVCAVTAQGSGFLDLSNIVRAVCIGVAVVCGILTVVTWKSSKPKG